MCTDYLATGEFFGDQGYEKIAMKLIAKYGAESALLLLELAPKLAQPSAELLNDPYIFPMFQSLFSTAAQNDDCFRMFLADKVFNEKKGTEIVTE